MNEVMAKFEAIMDHLKVPAFLVDVESDGTFVYRGLNAHHTSITGLESSALKGREVYEVLPKRFADTVSANYTKCVESRASYRYEEVLNFEVGEIWWLTTLSPVVDGDRVVGIIGLAENITEYKKQQFESVEAAVQMKKLSEDIGVFTALAAHDLRGPLRQIQLIAELINDGFVDHGDGKLELLAMVGKVTNNALTKVDEVLQHARTYTGEPGVHVEIDFAHLCADLVAILDPLSRFEVSYSNATIVTEPVTLQVALRNIVENALKHAHSKVAIDLEPETENEGFVKLSVSDDGPGFENPDREMEKIFAPRHEETKGFGLATVARLVASHGGKLQIGRPKFGKGATISWTLKADLLGNESA